MPEINTETCINEKGCDRCHEACPGLGINLYDISNKCFKSPQIVKDAKVGRYISCYTGYSNNHDIRYHCASGGLLSQLLIFLLEKKYIDGALVTAFDQDNEFLVKSYIAKTRDEVLAAKSSKYSPVTLNHAIKDILKDNGQRFIVVGLPCHIQGFRKYEAMDKKFKEKISAYFGIYCSGGRSFYLTEYIFKKWLINKKDLNYLSYRDEGCLGNLVAKGVDSISRKPFVFKKKYQQYYHPLRSFFIPRRCTLCIDHFAELADISFGDIHIEPYSRDKIGINSLITRNKKIDEWLREAKNEGCISLQNLEIDVLKKSQRVVFQKKYRSTTFMRLNKVFGRKNPSYDSIKKDPAPIKSTLSYIHTMLQIFIGRHKKLWFIIDILKK